MPGGLVAWQRQLLAFRGSLQTMLTQVNALLDILPDTHWDARVDAPAPSATSRSRSPSQSHDTSAPSIFWAGLTVQQTAVLHLERPGGELVRLGCNYPEMYLLIYFHVDERCNTYLQDGFYTVADLLAYVVRGTSMTASDVSLVNVDHHGCLEVQPSDVLSEFILAWRKDVERGDLHVEYLGNLPVFHFTPRRRAPRRGS